MLCHPRRPCGAHPRSRGEHSDETFGAYAAKGSSPLARGTRSSLSGSRSAFGLIPARAGNTCLRWAGRRLRWAHPRSRGEHPRRVVTHICEVGSSPLARGTPSGAVASAGAGGLIPARAGNTMPEMMMSGIIGAHPRSRGEHDRGNGESVYGLGSSPLARGTQEASAAARRYRAHPRSRGEHSSPPARMDLHEGSSPLARGTPPRSKGSVEYRWLIPARAGNTKGRFARARVNRAHPRSRGEHALTDALDAAGLGSSPLARGTPPLLWRGVRPMGLIPARAGNTERACCCCVACWAHPRSRGEHVPQICTQCYHMGSSPLARGTRGQWLVWGGQWGSSPLARGTRHPPRLVPDEAGLIPARAGNTVVTSLLKNPFGAHPRSRGEHCLPVHVAVVLAGSSPLARGTLYVYCR